MVPPSSALTPMAVPGGPLNVDVTYPVCISEPTEAVAGEALAWDLIKDYVHQVPGPNLSPAVPWGLTGAETHLGLTPPLPFADSIADPGRRGPGSDGFGRGRHRRLG